MSKKKFFIITTVPESLYFFNDQINIIKEKFDVKLVSSPGKEMKEICSKHHVEGFPIKMKREISPFADLVSLLNLILLFIYKRPFLVHGNTPKAGLLSMVASWITRIPKRVYYVHGLRYQGEVGKKMKILMFMERISCQLATDIIAVSNGVKDVLIEDGICKKPIKVIWNGSVNGINKDFFNSELVDESELRNNYHLKEDDFVFGFIGRIVGDKGINELVKAFKKLEDNNEKIKLLLVGKFENELDPLDNETIEEINNNKNIIYAGFQRDVRKHLKLMNVFVFPSYREGFGISLMEAGCMGIPSISSDILGCNEIIIHDQNGFLIRSKNEYDLYDKMRYCISNSQKIKDMSKESRRMMIDKFEQKQLWKKALDEYNRICNV